MKILRFDPVQRATHWANAVLFGALMFTAIPLYFGSFFGLVLPRHLIEQIHLWCGLALPVPLVLSLLGPWGRGMRHDVRRINYWTKSEIHWLRTFGRSRLDADKFNPGQKLNAIFVSVAIVVMLITGSMLQWFRFFSVDLRQGATFAHDVFALAIFVVVIGHIYMALTHRDSLRSMFKGWVSASWAKNHARAWFDETTAVKNVSDPE
ncbi:MAG: formate dehydrogenase gamma subunit [Acidimicrobiaceae bacterium]|nr:formate dehydrogenase gamma subunit [Acidimicrobiaceae bacterium]